MTAITVHTPREGSESTFQSVKQFTFTWGPRTIVAFIGGYYSLGLAYKYGIMAAIDKIAIPIIEEHVGCFGLGAAMPVFQWYSAWIVRLSAAITSSLIYDSVLKIFYFLKNRFI